MPIPDAPPPDFPRRFVFALSGGVDSVCLLDWLVAVGCRPVVAHFNHRWAPAENGVARFCARLATRLGLPFSLGTAAPGSARTEDAARQARYRFLLATARRRRLDAIVTAHTATDQAETLLLRLLRGSGARGLAGMRPESRRDGLRLLRPWLEVPREDVLLRAKRRKLAWREDPFNHDTRFLRVRVRHRVLPLLRRQFAADIETRLCRTAAILADEDRCLDAQARDALAAARDRSHPERLVTPALQSLPIALRRRVLLLWLEEHNLPDLGFADVRAAIDLLDSRGAASANLPGDHQLRRREKRLIILPVPAPKAPCCLKQKRHRGLNFLGIR